MNALTKAACSNINRENYIIAIVCGIVIGVMLGLGV
jgi:hypothetical protein